MKFFYVARMKKLIHAFDMKLLFYILADNFSIYIVWYFFDMYGTPNSFAENSGCRSSHGNAVLRCIYFKYFFIISIRKVTEFSKFCNNKKLYKPSHLEFDHSKDHFSNPLLYMNMYWTLFGNCMPHLHSLATLEGLLSQNKSCFFFFIY